MQFLATIGAWNRREIQVCHFKNYDLTYAFYSKFPSWGCPAKLCQITASQRHRTMTNQPNHHPFNAHPHSTLAQNNTTCNIFQTLTQFYNKMFDFRSFSATIQPKQRNPNSNLESSRSRVQKYGKPHSKCDLELVYDLNSAVCSSKKSKLNLSNTCLCDITSTLTCPVHTNKNENVFPNLHHYNHHFITLNLCLFTLVFSFNDFGSHLVLFSWWRDKISWELL